jgi:PAS domain S-box-containing protein
MDRHIRRIRGETPPERYSFRIIHSSGTILWVQLNAVVIQWNGKPATLNFMSDITERKKAEDQLREREEKYRLLFNMGVNAMFLVDNNTTQILECNNKASQLFGYSSEELLSMKMTDLSTTPEATRRTCQANVSKIERVYQKKDGGLISVDITSEHFFLADRAVHISAIRDITDKKLAEKVLESNYALLQIAGETAKFGGWSVDLEKNICTWSDAVADIHDMPHGYSPPVQEAINFYAPEWQGKITQIFSACAKEGISYDEEMEIITQKGKRVWVRATGKAVKNEKDKIIKVQGSFQDITERKQAEERLAHSQKLMQYIIEHTNSAVAVHDRNMHYIYVSQRYLDDYKVNENDIIGKHHYDVFPDLPQKWRDVHQKALAGKISKADRDPYFRDDGTIEWTRWECRPWYEENGSIGGIIVYTEVITDWINAQEKLRLSHERMLTILDSIDSTVYVADMDTCEILFMNKKMITDFGGDKTGDICYHAFRKNSEPCECCTNDQLVDKHGNPAGVCIWDDKNPVTGRDYINYDRAIEWTDGRLVRMQIATDITDLKKMESQLNQAQKMESVGRLAGGVAHDFNNMLGVILGHTELAMLHADENHDLHADLNEIQNAAKRSADLVKKLLAFARKEIISPRQLDLNDTVERMLNMLHRLIGEDIDLVWKPSAHLWHVKMDPSQIDQILANLCVNARDAISGVGKLTIETGIKTFDEEYCKEHAEFIPGDFVLLAVSDNGCGMDKETLDNLFEPFFTTKEVGKGTGLGLATVYGIVKQNNGFINVYSKPGQGSSFKIYLPRLAVDGEADQAIPEKKTTAGGTETILLVEDEPTILRMTRMMLERKGYIVLSAATPTEAIEKATIHTGSIDLLMTDVVMPEMNGRDLSGKITDLYPDIRVLFMSGYTANVIAHQGVLDDGVAFIQKPFSMAGMTEKVRELLDMASDKS